jgi:hypothetical protein
MHQLLARRPVHVSQLVMSCFVAVAALIAGLGVQDASAGMVIHGGPRR